MIKAYSAINLLALSTRTASGTGTTFQDNILAGADSVLFSILVTAQSGTTPTLDVAIQFGAGPNDWGNLARFSQYGAATGAKYVNCRRNLAASAEIVLVSDPAVGTGLLINNFDWFDYFRVKWTIAGTTPSYDFGVWAIPFYQFGR